MFFKANPSNTAAALHQRVADMPRVIGRAAQHLTTALPRMSLLEALPSSHKASARQKKKASKRAYGYFGGGGQAHHRQRHSHTDELLQSWLSPNSLPMAEACPSVSEWRTLNTSLDISDRVVEIYQPQNEQEAARIGEQVKLGFHLQPPPLPR